MGTAMTETLTPVELETELRRLEDELGMSVELAEHLATADALDAGLYQLLRRIRDLRWLQTS